MTHLMLETLWAALLPLIICGAVVLWITEGRQERCQRLTRGGMSQAQVADHLGISRYQVRKALGVA